MVAADPGRQDARTRKGPGRVRLALLLGPALAVTLLLFGGGLALGFLQAMGHLPAAGMERLGLGHFAAVLGDPDFLRSAGITFYLSGTSTLVAGLFSVLIALSLTRMARSRRWLHFLLQVPLTVPHLVIAVSVLFLLSPSGLLSRLLASAGLVESPSDFPLMVNDPWSIGILATYVWKEIPFITLMVLSVLRDSGSELLEVGRTLKAGPWQRFRYITLPVIFPSLAAACLIVFAFTFGAFEVPYLLGRTYPMSLPVWAYKNYSDVDLVARPEGIAIGLVIATVVASAVVLSQAVTQMARRRGVVL